MRLADDLVNWLGDVDGDWSPSVSLAA